MTETYENVRVFALVFAEMQRELRRQLAPLGVTAVFMERAAALPRADWWALWGSVSLLDPPPALLEYTPTANFQLWSDVPEAGGCDVIVEPFTDHEIQEAVLRAAESFEDRRLGGNEL